MATTKTNIIQKMGHARTQRAVFKRELAKQIPDMWKYANTLQPNKDQSYDLLARTISKANMMFEKSNFFKPDYQILTRLMYREYLGSFEGTRISDLYEFSTPINAGLAYIRPACVGAHIHHTH